MADPEGENQAPSGAVSRGPTPEPRTNGRASNDAPRVLVLYPFEASFIRSDIELLKRFSDVRTVCVTRRSQYPYVLAAMLESDIVLSWFALGYSLLAALAGRVLGKRTILVSGGWDVVGMHEISYGRLVSKRNVLEVKAILLSSDATLAFSRWSEGVMRRLAPEASIETVYLGIDAEVFVPAPKEEVVVCVGNVTQENLERKGLLTFARVTRLLADKRFILVGRHVDDAVKVLEATGGENLALPGWVPDEALREILSRAKVYVQPSYTEGFGMALAEAMASGCVPVVTREGAIPEVVGETGLYFNYGDVEGLAEAIRAALKTDLGEAARSRVVNKFDLERRADRLRAVVEFLWGRTATQHRRLLKLLERDGPDGS